MIKKFSSMISVLSALTVIASGIAYADGEKPATVIPPTVKSIQYYYEGMDTQWREACEAGRPAARFFLYKGPGSGYHPLSGYEYAYKDKTVLILLDNEAARKELIDYYKQKFYPISDQVNILNNNPKENLFMIWYNELEDISKKITIYTGIVPKHNRENLQWEQDICSHSRLRAFPDPELMPDIEWTNLISAMQRDLRCCTCSFGKVNFAWNLNQEKYLHTIKACD